MPQGTRLPVPIAALTGRRRTLAIYGDGEQAFVDDNWRNAPDARAYHNRQWRGRTELEVNVEILAMVTQ